ncbi:NUDIX domain-containing protein [Bailinhaonella thermotolerans]|uniref:8-oxo-dGTP diphosphatase n=1 Tax=Bailinhaonella thermotolerans TaxID=1070861 RepID=A0A3A4A7H6_9ACTN|nr:NUDIX domain-containing protein [Bailinhaonella thermotolerans]RJL23951.1 NUDIX domain-containing protein [Bailinhaonella thermotolerans]
MNDLQQMIDEARRDGIGKLVVGAVVHSGGRVLILRRAGDDEFLPGIEELPSGGLEDQEDPLTGLARELAEEIGWTGPVTVDPGFVAAFDYTTGSGRTARQLTFAVPAPDQPVRLSAEHTAHRWIHPADVGTTDVTPETAQTIHAWAQHSTPQA